MVNSTVSVTKFVRCAIYHRQTDAAGHFQGVQTSIPVETYNAFRFAGGGGGGGVIGPSPPPS